MKQKHKKNKYAYYVSMITCYSNCAVIFKLSSAPTAPSTPPLHPISRNLHSKLDLHSDRRSYGSGK